MQVTGNDLRIVIPARWSWYWFVGAPLIAILILSSARNKGLMESWVTASIVGVLLVVTILRQWLWIVGGREVVTLSANALIVRCQIFGVGWHWSYKVSGISNFRFAPPIRAYRANENRTVAFDYEFMPRRFGTYLSEAEANELIAVIQRYCSTAQPTAESCPVSVR